MTAPTHASAPVLGRVAWAAMQAVVAVAMVVTAFVMVTGWFWWTWGNIVGGGIALVAACWAGRPGARWAAAVALGVYGGINLLVLALAAAGGGASPLVLLPLLVIAGQAYVVRAAASARVAA